MFQLCKNMVEKKKKNPQKINRNCTNILPYYCCCYYYNNYTC